MTSRASLPSPPVIASAAEAIDAARSFARAIAPGASARDRDPRPPLAELEILSASGLLGLTAPRELGGADVSAETLAQVFQIVAAADPAIAQLPHSHFVFLNAVREDGTPSQKRLFFGEALAGALFGNAQAERGSASALDLRTRLNAAPGGYRLNGSKHYCTGAFAAQWIPVAAIDDAGRLALAYVPRQTPGVEALTDWNAMGQRVTFSGTVHLRDVVVPEEHVVAHWRLFERPSLFHPFAQLLHAAIDVGIAENALTDARSTVRSRKRSRLGAPAGNPSEDPLLILRFGQLLSKFHAAEALLYRAARLLDDAAPQVDETNAAEGAVAVSEAKAFAEEAAIEISGELFALAGSSSTDNDLNLHRHWRNARTHTAHDANQWRYHSAGNYFLNGIAPGKPARQLANEERTSSVPRTTSGI